MQKCFGVPLHVCVSSKSTTQKKNSKIFLSLATILSKWTQVFVLLSADTCAQVGLTVA